MSRQVGSVVLVLVMLLFEGHVSSGATPAGAKVFPTQDEIISLLSSRHYAELDRRFTSVQEGYKHGTVSDVQLREAFRAFYFTTPSVAGSFDEWVEQFPHSYVAHLARGIYYKKIGQERRGGDVAAQTSAEQFRAMEEALAKASADFEQSMTLDDKPLLSFLHQLTVYELLGRNADERALLDRSIAMDRNNFVVRYAYMNALESRWGGSVEQMRRFLKECGEARLSMSEMKSLEALVVDDEAWNDRYVEHDSAAAVQAYGREAKLNPQQACAPCGPIHQAADTLLDDKKYVEAIKLYSQILRYDPKDTDALNSRAFGELQLKRPAQAVRDLTQSAQQGSPYAQDTLGRMYLMGISVPQDRDKAIEWLTKAADQGYGGSKELLQTARNGNIKVVPSPGGPQP